jgi:class 3 adenylate cyclase
VGKANVSRQALVEAIATLEAQRGLAVNDPDLNQAVDTVLLLLRDKLAQVQAEPGDKKRHQLAVLVADLSGFTTLSEHMDVERVREAINAMWRVLDAVIRSWGGQIDQHAGDSLMALFGLSYPRRGDAARALHAALAMQQELALFNERARRAAVDPLDESWVGEWPGPNMRIGVHSGPVFFARAPQGGRAPGGRPAALGDTIALTRRLEKAAPAGGVLASADVQAQAGDGFAFNVLPGAAGGLKGSDGAALVIAERPVALNYTPGTVAGQVTRFVGRTGLMDRLEMALQTAADSLSPQLVTIVGAPGAGKSRLVHEFEQHARLLGGPTVLRAGTQGACPDYPYALVRDLLLRRFAIRPQHSTYLIDAKLRQGVADLERRGNEFGASVEAGALTQTISLLKRLLGVQTAAAIPAQEVLAALVPLLQAITATGEPAIVVLEGINRADRRSLELVDRLVREGEAGPVLFLGLATATATATPERVLPWLTRESDVFSPMERVDISPLSAVDSRLMATEILHRLPSPSMRLLDLTVAEAGGNPLYIESFAQLLIDRGVITIGEQWRVDMSRAEEMALPAGLEAVIEARLMELPELERSVLRNAAVFGPLSWDMALVEMEPTAEADEIDAALLALESKDYLVRDDVYSFGGAQAYAFRRDTVREVAYATVPLATRRAMHRAAARWLIAIHDSSGYGAWLPIDFLISRHLAAAGDAVEADAWRQRADIPGLSS